MVRKAFPPIFSALSQSILVYSKMKFIQFILILSILFIGCKSAKQITEDNSKSDYDINFVDYLFKDYSENRPSASVLVIKDGEIELAKSYGYADLDNKILATPETNYRIASVTKQFTAMAIMILIDQDKLSYETRITDVFPEFPKYGNDITIKQLLTHRSGLVRYNRFIEEGRTEQLLDKDVLAGLLETDSTYFQPNTKYAYSNTGYAVLAEVVAKISGVSFADFMQKEIFQPLEMTNSTILEIDKDIKNRAYGYVVKDTSITAKDQSITSAIQGDGGVYTSAFDYYKWDKALYSNELIQQEKLDDAFYNYDANGKSNEDGYGYGWKIHYFKGSKILQHGGSSTGFGSHVIRIPSEGISVAIFTNRNKRGQELRNRAKALISHFTNCKFQMPFEIVVEKEINQKGIEKGIELYNEIKTDTINYAVSKGALFKFGIAFINANKNNNALRLFEVLEQDYPTYFGGYYGTAVVYQQLKDTEKAVEHFNKTIKFCTKDEGWAADHAEKMIKELLE
ncbi:MAG: CubicO group peptidase (beta-lactamase class C family) [Bacteroidia bacterium]|jgi:CubicO group peptidase (beta-lactamase class C family)